MLALSRKKNESIIVNNDVEITILEIKGDQVKIGITAPKSVPIYRKEVYLQIKEANEAAIASEKVNQPALLFSSSLMDSFSASPASMRYVILRCK